MLKNAKLGTKLIFAFMSVAVITLILGGVGFYGAVQSEDAIEEIGQVRLTSIDSLLIIQNMAGDIRGALRTLSIDGLDPETRQRQYNNIAAARERYQNYWEIYEPLPQTPEETQYWNQFVPAWEAFVAENARALELAQQFDRFGIQDPGDLSRRLEQFTKDHYILVNNIRNLLDEPTKTFDGGQDHTACNAGQFFPTFKTSNNEFISALRDFNDPHRRFHEAIGQIKNLVAADKVDDARRVYQENLAPAMGDVFRSFDSMLTIANNAYIAKSAAQDQIMGPCAVTQYSALDLLRRVVDINREIATVEVERAHSQAIFIEALSVIATVIGVVLAITLGIVITRAITKPISRIIDDLTNGAEQVSSASSQVSASSQSLAEGSSEQAAGLEETSSSLEEMASMTRQNSDNAQQANSLASEANGAAQKGTESMSKMSQAINEIQRSSEETSKIIKVIDEIAFQTNLLALNAAVEAARAGEAGKGFAVVAEEVRNLAMRSAEAAKNTSAMIEASVKNATNGVEITNEVAASLEEITTLSQKVSNLIGEISSASQEQTQGIDQVNTAMSQMDQVTQQNAANAEESASAAEELNAQAEQMNEVINQLAVLIGGSSVQRSNAGPSPARKLAKSDMSFHQIASGKGTKSGSQKQWDKKTQPAKAAAGKQIPFDDDFTEF